MDITLPAMIILGHSSFAEFCEISLQFDVAESIHPSIHIRLVTKLVKPQWNRAYESRNIVNFN